MSVSIHHIYSSVTAILSLVSSAALLPSENTQTRTVCRLVRDDRILSRTDRVYSSSHPGQITLLEETGETCEICSSRCL